jgi:hypothetical protein
MILQLSRHRRFGQLLEQWRQNATLTAQVLAFPQYLDGSFHIEFDVVINWSSLFLASLKN